MPVAVLLYTKLWDTLPEAGLKAWAGHHIPTWKRGAFGRAWQSPKSHCHAGSRAGGGRRVTLPAPRTLGRRFLDSVPSSSFQQTLWPIDWACVGGKGDPCPGRGEVTGQGWLWLQCLPGDCEAWLSLWVNAGWSQQETTGFLCRCSSNSASRSWRPKGHICLWRYIPA